MNSQLVFETTMSQNYSSGERVQAHLKELLDIKFEGAARGIILLDEWDANLDDLSEKSLSSLISVVAKNNLIIEVRHAKLPVRSIDDTSKNGSVVMFSRFAKTSLKDKDDGKLEVVVDTTRDSQTSAVATEKDRLIRP